MPKDEPATASSPKFQLVDVTVRFGSRNGDVVALDRVSLDVRPGEFVCLVGPSGCGKTTLLNVLAGLAIPPEGTALMDGMPIQRPGPDRALIFQESALFPWLSAVQNVEFALKQSIRDKHERRERALHFLKMVHLSRFAASSPHELSGGMRHRVAIARALAMNPDVLLMDEPFASLDAQTRDMLIQEVQSIWLETHKTIVFVTHNVLEAVTLGDRVFVMGTRPGRVKQVLDVGLTRPREVRAPETATIAQQILADLKDEITKIAREERDVDDAERA